MKREKNSGFEKKRGERARSVSRSSNSRDLTKKTRRVLAINGRTSAATLPISIDTLAHNYTSHSHPKRAAILRWRRNHSAGNVTTAASADRASSHPLYRRGYAALARVFRLDSYRRCTSESFAPQGGNLRGRERRMRKHTHLDLFSRDLRISPPETTPTLRPATSSRRKLSNLFPSLSLPSLLMGSRGDTV